MALHVSWSSYRQPEHPRLTGVSSAATTSPLLSLVVLVEGGDEGNVAGEGCCTPGNGSVRGTLKPFGAAEQLLQPATGLLCLLWGRQSLGIGRNRYAAQLGIAQGRSPPACYMPQHAGPMQSSNAPGNQPTGRKPTRVACWKLPSFLGDGPTSYCVSLANLWAFSCA